MSSKIKGDDGRAATRATSFSPTRVRDARRVVKLCSKIVRSLLSDHPLERISSELLVEELVAIVELYNDHRE